MKRLNMKKTIIFFLITFLFSINVHSQELNAKVTVNSDKIQGVSKDIFTELQTSVTQFLNENRWTEATFGTNEKIACTFLITISSADGTKYTGDLQITSSRPVYNSSYTTSLFNFKDVDFTIDYMQGQQLDYNQTMVTSNLAGILSFYAYVLIGLDFDSFSLNGGRTYFEQAMAITNAAQSLSEKGWKAFDSDKNRYALALALTEESSRSFHDMWYNYHRKGLDEMAANPSRGRLQIIESLTDINTLYQARPSSVLLLMYGDTKLTEAISILEKANAEEKKDAYDLFSKIYPTKSTVLSKLKN